VKRLKAEDVGRFRKLSQRVAFPTSLSSFHASPPKQPTPGASTTCLPCLCIWALARHKAITSQLCTFGSCGWRSTTSREFGGAGGTHLVLWRTTRDHYQHGDWLLYSAIKQIIVPTCKALQIIDHIFTWPAICQIRLFLIWVLSAD
jgi:hypothetical protein